MSSRKEKYKAIRRGVYHAPHANDVWHIDGNQKLMKWHFVVHGGIPAFTSHYIPEVPHNNHAETVLSTFQLGVNRYGLPKKLCSYHGGENINVWRYIMTAHGHHQCVIVGSFTHDE